MEESIAERYFPSRLKDTIAKCGLTPHGVAVAAGISPPNLYNILGGKRTPSDAEIDKLAAVPGLNLSVQAMRAWADADKLGAQRVSGIKDLFQYDLLTAKLRDLTTEINSLIDEIKKKDSEGDNPEVARELYAKVERLVQARSVIISEMMDASEEMGIEVPSLNTFLDEKWPRFRTSLSEAKKYKSMPRLSGPQILFNALTLVEGAVSSQYPATSEEIDLIDEARKLEVWTTELNDPELWDIPPEHEQRLAIFGYLESLIREARAYKVRKLGGD